MTQKLVMWFGVILTLVGVLGFIPGVTNDDGKLLGIFAVDTLHNVIHLASGILGIFAARMGASQAAMFAKIFGLVYALVTIVGFVQGDTVVGLFGVNMADNVLHLLVAVIFLYAGFSNKGGSAPASPMPMQV